MQYGLDVMQFGRCTNGTQRYTGWRWCPFEWRQGNMPEVPENMQTRTTTERGRLL